MDDSFEIFSHWAKLSLERYLQLPTGYIDLKCKLKTTCLWNKVFHVQGRSLKCMDFLTHINIRSPVVKAVKLMACNSATSPLKISSYIR